MSQINFSMQAMSDPRLAIYAVSSAPAWVWSADGTRILWANAAGKAFFGAKDDAAMANAAIGPADPHRRQVMYLASRLPPAGTQRLERLRGFGAPLGMLMTCACSRVTLQDGTNGVLIAASETTARTWPFNERLMQFITTLDGPAAAFGADGSLIGTNLAARALPDLSIIAPAISHHLLRGNVAAEASKISTPLGKVRLHPVGLGFETGIIALITPEPATGTTTQSETVPPAVTESVPAVIAAANENAARKMEETPDTEMPQPGLTATPIEAPAEIQSNTELVEPQSGTTETSAPATAEETHHDAPPIAPPPALVTAAATPFLDDTLTARRRHPLRFMWQMDADGRFSFGSDEFTRLIGTRTAAAFGRLWGEIADVLGLDPEGRVAQAFATHNTWSGIVVPWPVDGSGERLPVEMSGLPIYDDARQFAGYRGFGICRDLEGLTRLAAKRNHDALFASQPPTNPPSDAPSSPMPQETAQDGHATLASEPTAPPPEHQPVITETNRAVEPPLNVVPFRGNGEQKPQTLTPADDHTFKEIGRQLSARLDDEAAKKAAASDAPAPAETDEAEKPETEPEAQPSTPAAPWLQPDPAPPLRVQSALDTQLFDRLPIGVLVYRLDRLIYANRAFLEQTGFENLHTLTEAGGLDALYVEPGTAQAGLPSEGTPVVISTSHSTAINAHLHAIDWDGESAHALIFSPPTAPAQSDRQDEPVAKPSTDQIQAEELATILETTAEGIVVFDGLARINSCNRSAEALFGLGSRDITGSSLIDLFAPESQRGILDYLESVKTSGVASLLDHGRDVLGRASDGSTIPLSVTMGRTRPESARYFAIFRDKTPVRPSENEVLALRRATDRLAGAKAEVLARISHEVRTPLNAIIGFAEVMIEERFGPLGNERYVDYMKDIRASGERVIAIIDDMLDLSRIESGKLDLSFSNQELNPLIEQCVAALQPHANRARIIIRTSLAHALPVVQADARALKQIALNLIGSSIQLANAGGQVIVSTATTDRGEVVLRVRDTGHGLNDNEIAAAMAPFRTPTASDRLPSDHGANLSLTKALVEANRAQFNIKSGPNSGTLIEVVFSKTAAIA